MMTENKRDLRDVLSEAHAYFFLLRGEETIRLRLWDIKEDSIVIDMPESASMRRTLLGLIPTLDGSAVYEIDGAVDAEADPEQMPDTLRVRVDPGKVKRVNRRLFPRVHFTPPIDAVILVTGEDRTVFGRILNLSAGGLRVETMEALPPERRLIFNFEIECDEITHVLSPAGAIIYEIPSNAGHAYGVRFETSEGKAVVKGEEASLESIERTIDLLTLVNTLLVRI
jgi:hypothetical protein